MEVMRKLAGWVSLVLCVHGLRAGERARGGERRGKGRGGEGGGEGEKGDLGGSGLGQDRRETGSTHCP